MAGDDFSIFEVTTTETFDVIPLGTDVTVIGTTVLNVASPLGLGKQYFEGYVSATRIDRPALDAGEVKWSNVLLVQIGSGPGSSGSAIVAEDQKAIVGFLVGGFRANIGAICVPVSQFKAFEAKVDAGSYKRKPRFDFLKGLFGGGE
jgi:S1-C subfamily serine protease